MLNLHLRQTKRRYQPEGPEFVEGWIEIIDPRLTDLLSCESDVPNQDDFKKVGNWRAAMQLAVKRHRDKAKFFAEGGTGGELPSAKRMHRKASDFVRVLTQLLKETPDDDVEYSESWETYVADWFPPGDIDYEGD